MMSALYKEEGSSLRVEILEEPEVTSFIDAHAQILDSSFAQTDMSDIMKERLQNSDWIFSGMKTFHELNEAFPSLLDENGHRKSFEQFLNDVQKIDDTYNRNYLNAEYNFAQASAEMAGKWESFRKDDDYLLQYRTQQDGKVRPEHATLHGVTLPADDSFWDEYYPPNGWNCRCTVAQVRKEKYAQTDHDEAMRRAEVAIPDEKTRQMFGFNPGKEQRAFPAYNPYTISKCNNCDKSKHYLAFIPDNQVCSSCGIIQKCSKKRTVSEIRIIAKQTLQGKQISNPEFSHEVKISGRSIKEWLNQPHKNFEAKNHLLLSIEDVFKKSKYIGVSFYKEQPAHIFETILCGEKTWIVVRQYPDHYILHSISDNRNIMSNIQQTP